MKSDSRTTAVNTKSSTETMSQAEIDAVSGGSFALARPGETNAGWYARSTGPLIGGYRTA